MSQPEQQPAPEAKKDAVKPCVAKEDKTPKGEKTKHGTGSKRGRSVADGMIEVEPVVGTRDVYPEDMRLRSWLFGHFREVARQFCFQEYDAPILELAELYKRKAGEEITDQMYNFIDKEDYHVTLRPEMTPTLARMILKKGRALLLPVRWFSIPQCWRFENVQVGRKREHYQWNMDVVGVESVTAEAELLAAIVGLFQRLGLTAKDVGLKVNSRKVLQAVLEPLGVTAELFAPVCVIVDKLDKLPPAAVQEQLTALGLKMDVIEKIQQTLSIKDLNALETVLPADSPILKELRYFWSLCEGYGILDWITFDASVVRGLAYYTGIVFEGFDRAGKFRAICGGGRYDRLFSLYGAKQPIPACGFGFGDCVIVELLKDKKLLPSVDPQVEFIVTPFDESLRPVACQIAAKIRALPGNPRVDLQLMPGKKLPWCYSYADRIGAQKLILIAPDEWAKNCIRVKNLRAKEDDPNKEFDLPVADLVKLVQ